MKDLDSMSSSPMLHVMIAADRNYGGYAGLVMQSIMFVTNRSKIHFHLLSDHVDAEDIEKCRKMARSTGTDFSAYEVSNKLESLPNALRFANHISRSTLSRLLFSDLLPQDVHHVIYLDCDVVCRRDLTDLWSLRENLELIGAVRDPWLDSSLELKRSLGLAPEQPYFNAGVLLINVDNWRALDIEGRLCKFIQERSDIKNADQDALNGVLSEYFVEFPEKWNTMINHPNVSDEPRLRDSAAILHYVGGFKPWHLGYGVAHPVKSKPYVSVKRRSPWKSKLPDFQMRRVTQKIRSLMRT